MIRAIEAFGNYAVQAVAKMIRDGHDRVQIKDSAVQEFDAFAQRTLQGSVWTDTCNCQ